jgi:hypothetical protein
MHKMLVIAGCATLVAAGCSHSATGNAGERQPGPQPASSADTQRPVSLCQRQETIIYSCRIRSSGKLASLCAPSDFTSSPRRGVYYVFGKPDAVEMRYPNGTSASGGKFNQAHLVFAGATGGYAYSFVKDGFKYLLYSISGTGVEDQGVIVAKVGEIVPVVELPCAPDSMVESDLRVFDAAATWPEDADVAGHGLPRR